MSSTRLRLFGPSAEDGSGRTLPGSQLTLGALWLSVSPALHYRLLTPNHYRISTPPQGGVSLTLIGSAMAEHQARKWT